MRQTFPAAILLVLSSGPGLAQGLPSFDIEATCREAQPLGPEDRDPYQGCMPRLGSVQLVPHKHRETNFRIKFRKDPGTASLPLRDGTGGWVRPH